MQQGARPSLRRRTATVTTMRFDTLAAMMGFMSDARDTVLANAACEVNWVHRHGCPVPVGLARGGADQTCACKPYAMLTIRHGLQADARRS